MKSRLVIWTSAAFVAVAFGAAAANADVVYDVTIPYSVDAVAPSAATNLLAGQNSSYCDIGNSNGDTFSFDYWIGISGNYTGATLAAQTTFAMKNVGLMGGLINFMDSGNTSSSRTATCPRRSPSTGQREHQPTVRTPRTRTAGISE